MPQHTDLILFVAVGFGLAFLLGLLANKLKLPPLVGYLVAGVAVGPFTPGFVGDQDLAAQLAEIGVILLMFGVGMHFSVRDLLDVRHISLPGAVFQITVATLLGIGLTQLWGWTLGEGLVMGLALSVASTVVLLRALEDQGLLDSVDGKIAVGWLIVEDIAMVLALVLLPALAEPLGGTASDGAGGPLIVTLALTLAKVVAFLAVMWIGGRRVVPWFLGQVIRSGSRELFTLAVLAIALGIAVAAAALFGVSLALGAFIAGLVVSESEVSEQTAADAVPFQDAFAVLFFVSVGMLFDPTVLVTDPLRVLAVLLIIVIGKSLAAFFIVVVFRYPLRTAMVVAASLAQIGEFSFILVVLGGSLDLLPDSAQSLVLAGALLSITLNPAVFRVVGPISRWIRARPRLLSALERPAGDLIELPDTAREEELTGHAVVVGHGRVGTPLADALRRHGIPYVVVEQNRELVSKLQDRGLPVIYGDASRPGILDHAHLERARLLLVTTPDVFEARLIIDLAKGINPDIDVAVRTHSDQEREEMEGRGVGRAVVAEREVALALLRYTFGTFEVDADMLDVAVKTLQLSNPHDGRAEQA